MAVAKGTTGTAGRIEALFDPQSVAVVGASANMRKWGGMAAEQALRDAARRTVYLVNARGEPIMGVSSHRAYADLPQAPELAVVTVPQPAFEAAVDEILARGTRSIVAITAGFAEEGAEGAAIQQRVRQAVRAVGGAMVGPNCMGVFDGHAPFRCMPWAELPTGAVGLLSQSGGHIMDIADQLQTAGQGLSRVASVGNEADVAIPDLIENLAGHEPTRVILLYSEDFADPDRLFGTIAATVGGGKPVVLMTPRSGSGARRAARSHTGSDLIELADIRRLAGEAGALHCLSPQEAVETALGLLAPERATGRRVAVLTDTGGPGVLCAGLCEERGLLVPALSLSLQAALAERLSPRATLNNPVDLVDNLDVDDVVTALDVLLGAAEVDAVLLNVHAFVHDTPEQEQAASARIHAAVRRHGKPVSVVSRAQAAPGVLHLRTLGIPVHRHAEGAVRALLAAVPMAGGR